MKQLKHLFVCSEKEFRSYQYLVGNVFDQNRKLPQQVFRKNFDCFLFQEFDWALSDDILTSIKQLSNLTKDREFLTAVLQPDPVEYYMKEFGYYNWLSTTEDYFDFQLPDTCQAHVKDENEWIIFLREMTNHPELLDRLWMKDQEQLDIVHLLNYSSFYTTESWFHPEAENQLPSQSIFFNRLLRVWFIKIHHSTCEDEHSLDIMDTH
ncbi:hypothetical protein QQS15_04965 [Bacillus pumilus]|uniref:hypothetical protein n=1 Tax=Bacillus pumilus TaxID=1408 RepID=UPI00345EAB3B